MAHSLYSALSVDDRVDLLVASRRPTTTTIDEDGRTVTETGGVLAVDEGSLGLPDGVGDLLERIEAATNPLELFAWFPAAGY